MSEESYKPEDVIVQSGPDMVKISDEELDGIGPDAAVEDVSKAQYMAEAGDADRSEAAYNRQILDIKQQYSPQFKSDLERVDWLSELPKSEKEVVNKRMWQVCEEVRVKIESILAHYPEVPHAKSVKVQGGLEIRDIWEFLSGRSVGVLSPKPMQSAVEFSDKYADKSEVKAGKEYDSNPASGESHPVEDKSKAYEMALAADEWGTGRGTDAERRAKKHEIGSRIEELTGILYDHPVSEAYKDAHPTIDFSTESIAYLEKAVKRQQAYEKDIESIHNNEELYNIYVDYFGKTTPYQEPSSEQMVVIDDILSGRTN